MSRSNPESKSQHPCSKWLEWGGADGQFSYWNKSEKKRVPVPLPMAFLYLEDTATVTGYNNPSASGIFANEVKRATVTPLVVKAFKGGQIASGLWPEIKPSVKAAGGKFTSNTYCAVKDATGKLELACIQWTGAGLKAWFDFFKKHNAEVHNQAVVVTGYTTGKVGMVQFAIPQFALKPVSAETNDAATILEKELLAYLKEYWSRTLAPATHAVGEHVQPDAAESFDQDCPPDPVEPDIAGEDMPF